MRWGRKEATGQRGKKGAQISREYRCKCSPPVQLLHLLDGARPVDPIRRCCSCGALPRSGSVDMINVEYPPVAVYPSFPI